jgi:hypothetical protein
MCQTKVIVKNETHDILLVIKKVSDGDPVSVLDGKQMVSQSGCLLCGSQIQECSGSHPHTYFFLLTYHWV